MSHTTTSKCDALRTHDYTPVYVPDCGYGAEYQKVSGDAEKFGAFITRQLIPYVERNLRALL